MQSIPIKMPALAVAIASLLDERPMHPYEISATMRERHMEAAVKLNYGALYHVVERMAAMGVIEPVETSRDGRRPERTVYRLTTTGRERYLERLRELVGTVTKEYREFEAGLALMHHLDREEAIELLEHRARLLERLSAAAEGTFQGLRQSGVPRLALVEVEHATALQRAELAWVRSLVDDIRDGKLEWNATPVEGTQEVG